MPSYEFKCQKCGYEFEWVQRMNDPNPPCPAEIPFSPDNKTAPKKAARTVTCGGETKKLISVSSFILKGDGWASDGYGGGST